MIGEGLGEWSEVLLRTARLCRLFELASLKKEDEVVVTRQGGTLHKQKKRRFSPFTERTSLLVRISLILIQVIPVPRILRLSPHGV